MDHLNKDEIKAKEFKVLLEMEKSCLKWSSQPSLGSWTTESTVISIHSCRYGISPSYIQTLTHTYILSLHTYSCVTRLHSALTQTHTQRHITKHQNTHPYTQVSPTHHLSPQLSLSRTRVGTHTHTPLKLPFASQNYRDHASGRLRGLFWCSD